VAEFALRYDGNLLRSGDMTGREVVDLERALGVGYLDIRPGSNVAHRMAMLAVFLRREHDEAETEKILDGLSLRDLDRMIEVVEDDLPTLFEDGIPKEEAEVTTRTS
jgi:hypothetical protein